WAPAASCFTRTWPGCPARAMAGATPSTWPSRCPTASPSRMRFLVLACLAFSLVAPAAAEESVYLDGAGVIRWRADGSEVALFGACYCLPSASDYRAAGYLGVDRKKLIE